jgi:hypothetical protein
MSEHRSAPPPPLVLAMLMADAAARDPATGKFTITGTFNIIRSKKFPCRHKAMSVYLSLIGGHGAVPTTLRLVDVDELREPIFSVEPVMRFEEPTQWLEWSGNFQGYEFPEPGDYRLQLFVAGELLRELRLKVRKDA